MTASPRAARSLDDALGQALEDLEAGLTPLQVLDRHPEYEAELGSLIETAYRLRTTRWPVLSMAARVQGRERMHAALAAHKVRHRFLIPPIWRPLGAGIALAFLAGTTYLASPLSPLHSTNPPPLPTTTPLIAVTTATWTTEVSATPRPSATTSALVTPLASPTRVIRSLIEPTEAIDRIGDVTRSPLTKATATPQRSTRTATATPTRTPTATITPTTIASSTPSAAAAVTQVAGDIQPAQPTSTVFVPTVVAPTLAAPTIIVPTDTAGPTITATSTLPPATLAPTEPAPTSTPLPTEEPEPTHSPTPMPPTPALSATETPIPTATPMLAIPTVNFRTPLRQTRTPEPAKTPKHEETADPGDPPRLPAVVPGSHAGTGPEIRATIREWLRSELPRPRNNRP